MSDRVRRRLRLARWLGPWTASDRAPDDVTCTSIDVAGERPFEAWLLRPRDRRPRGALLVVPGLHYAGPADPRFDRFVRVLASSGLAVLAPFLPDYRAMTLEPRVLADTDRALDALLAAEPSLRPGVFSISFGSMPALRLAAARSSELSGLVVFGGFADFRRALRFALGTDGERVNDPLNAPVVFLNLLPFLDVADAHREPLARALRHYCERTWGREDHKRPEVYGPVAAAIARELPEAVRELFLVACRARPGTTTRAERALERSGAAFDWIDPRPHLSAIRCPVTLVHGRDDDVIPYEESLDLERALAPHTRVRTLLTGLYGHTKNEAGALSEGPLVLWRELSTMVGILDAIARTAG